MIKSIYHLSHTTQGQERIEKSEETGEGLLSVRALVVGPAWQTTIAVWDVAREWIAAHVNCSYQPLFALLFPERSLTIHHYMLHVQKCLIRQLCILLCDRSDGNHHIMGQDSICIQLVNRRIPILHVWWGITCMFTFSMEKGLKRFYKRICKGHYGPEMLGSMVLAIWMGTF